MLHDGNSNSEFVAEIKNLAGRSKRAAQKHSNESATIHSVILPFIKALGYDVFNDEEVVSEFSADVGIKTGEKVDYALKVNGAPAIIIEVKAITTSLGQHHQSQLFRYFVTTDVKVAILTNGKEAWFYSDFNKNNVMDDEPFFKFDFQENNETDINFLYRFHKNCFSIHEIIKLAHEIMRQAEAQRNLDKVKGFIQSDIINPNENFVKFVGKAVMGHAPRKNEFAGFQSSIISAFDEILQKSSAESKATLPTFKPNNHNNPGSQKSSKKEWHSEEWHELRKQHWENFKNFLGNNSILTMGKASRWGDQRFNSWNNSHFTLVGYANDNSIAASIYVGKDNESVNQQIYQFLHDKEQFIKEQISHNITWKLNKGNRFTIILREEANISTTDPNLLNRQFSWLKANLEMFHNVFFPLTRDIET